MVWKRKNTVFLFICCLLLAAAILWARSRDATEKGALRASKAPVSATSTGPVLDPESQLASVENFREFEKLYGEARNKGKSILGTVTLPAIGWESAAFSLPDGLSSAGLKRICKGNIPANRVCVVARLMSGREITYFGITSEGNVVEYTTLAADVQ